MTTPIAIGLLLLILIDIGLAIANHLLHWRDPEELDEPERTLEPGPRWGRP